MSKVCFITGYSKGFGCGLTQELPKLTYARVVTIALSLLRKVCQKA